MYLRNYENNSSLIFINLMDRKLIASNKLINEGIMHPIVVKTKKKEKGIRIRLRKKFIAFYTHFHIYSTVSKKFSVRTSFSLWSRNFNNNNFL